jgi:predicted  nucleic acid-binding Zn-ribbon protein
MSLAYSCPKCNARPYQACRSVNGKPTSPHVARANGPRPETKVAYNVCDPYAKLRSIYEVDVHADNWTPRRVESPSPLSSRTDASEAELDDAIRYLSNLEMGRTDDTLDPAEIITDLMRMVRERYSADEWESRGNEIAELEEEVETLQKRVKTLQAEADAALERELTMTAKRDQAQDDLAALQARCGASKATPGSLDRASDALDSALNSLDATNAILERLGL